VLESRRLELEAVGAKRMELDRIVEQAVQLAGEFDRAFAEGTIEEKRLLVRAFVKEIVVDPEYGAVKARIVAVPGVEVGVAEAVGTRYIGCVSETLP